MRAWAPFYEHYNLWGPMNLLNGSAMYCIHVDTVVQKKIIINKLLSLHVELSVFSVQVHTPGTFTGVVFRSDRIVVY